jgi:mono/diheme cytochrome c family protein
MMRSISFAMLLAMVPLIASMGLTHAQPVDSGKKEYLRSCASCHGPTGKGDGPNAKDLQHRPKDLSQLARANGGEFPLVRAFNVIDGRVDVVIHGPREMPIWGDVLRRDLTSRMPRNYMSPEMADAMGYIRILEVIEYIMTLQDK